MGPSMSIDGVRRRLPEVATPPVLASMGPSMSIDGVHLHWSAWRAGAGELQWGRR